MGREPVLFLLILVCLGAVLALFRSGLQNKMLYYPSAALPTEQLLAARHLRFWPSPGAAYRGLAPVNDADYPRGTIVVFHGNGGTAVDRVYYAQVLGRLGYRVILAEYPGYGGRQGPLGERSFVNDADGTLHLAFETHGRPLFVLGESLGCGVAAAVSAITPVDIDGMILITPWDTLAAVAKAVFPFVPVRLFLTDAYDSIGHLASFKGKIAVVGAAEDAVIPLRHARRLFLSLPTADKKMWVVDGAGHNTWPDAVDVDWWKEITAFLSAE